MHNENSGILLHVVVLQSAAILQLAAPEDEANLGLREVFHAADFCPDFVDGVAGLHVEGCCLAVEVLVEDLVGLLSLQRLPQTKNKNKKHRTIFGWAFMRIWRNHFWITPAENS